MKLLIEDFPYPAEKVRGLLGGDEPFETDGISRISKVGYYYNPSIKDCVFILPKVILDEGRDSVFGTFNPTDIIDIDQCFRDEKLSIEQRMFIFNLSTWIYRAIAEFVRINNELPEERRSRIVYRRHFSSVAHNGDRTDGTLIDIILSLIKFANENKDFLMFVVKNIHSGYNKINWNKTISHKTAIIKDGQPMYMDMINRKKQINFDEELLVIFYSTLFYIRETFGFPINIPFNFSLITGPKFQTYLAGYGKTRLLQIKYKYFSDKALKLWHLCYTFFALLEQFASNATESEYLLASNFNIVFETMIDELVSDKNIPSALRDQRDGKIVDHIYSYESLIAPDDIYYIGDSKYYKIGGSVHGKSEYKQYTYARNVIHYNLDLLVRYGEDGAVARGALPYLDKLTDGYNVTPNFFISAEIDRDYSYNEPGIHLHRAADGKTYAVTKHFENRLFDRDTLWLSHYDINFLYVLALFVSPYQSIKEEFKENLRIRFRKHIIGLLNGMYEFYTINIGEEEMKDFVNRNFRELTGKIFHFNNILLLALEKDHEDTLKLKNKYIQYLSDYKLV